MYLFFKFIKESVLILSIIFFLNDLCWALSAESVYPRLGQMGTDLDVTVYGEGFDADTQLSMYLDSGNSSNIIGSATTTGSAAGVVVVGTIAYVANYTADLELFDISNPSKPFYICTAETEGTTGTGTAYDVTVQGDIAYVAAGFNGLLTIDVNPQSLTFCERMGEYNTSTLARDVTVVGNIAYVSDSGAGMHVINVSDPEHPAYINTVPTAPGVAYEVSVQADFAYLAAANGGLKIINLNPNHLVYSYLEIVGEVDTPDTAFGVTVIGNIAYVADGNSGLQVVDVGDPENPQIIGSKVTPGIAVKVTVVGDLAYVADGSKDLQLIDINPASATYLQIVGLVAVPGGAINVTVIGDIAYVADDSEGLQVIDISNPTLPMVMGATLTSGRSYGVEIIGDFAYVADGTGGLKVIDVSTPSQPVITNEIAINGFARDVTVDGGNEGIAYVAYGSIEGPKGLQLIDLSKLDDPSPPPAVFVATPGIARNVTVAGSYAYVACESSGLQVVNVSDPGNPYITGTGYSTAPQYAYDVAVSGDIAYLTVHPYQLTATDKSRLQILNVSNPSNPTPFSPTSSVETYNYAYGVRLVGTIAYVADGNLGLTLVNVSNSSIPSIIGTVDTPGTANNVTVVGDTAYVADIYSGLQVIDVDQGSSTFLHITASVDTPGYALDATVIGGIAYVANFTEGFVTFPVPVKIPIPTSSLSSTQFTATLPSPPVSGNYTLRVFNSASHDELIGAITFTDQIKLLSSKAIIVAGGGPDAGNQIWTETKAYANQAYDNLIYQGYKHEDIMYLTDEDPNPLVSSLKYDPAVLPDPSNVWPATKANLESGIKTWAKSGGTSDLLIFMEDHGEAEKFLMRGGASPQYLTADELDSWLDTLQSTLPGKVILVYDACNSGSFIARLTPPSDKKRFILTSSTPDQVAYFLNLNHSFSSHFWSTFSGKSGDKTVMTDALDRAATEMASYQTAQLDADGDGVPNQPSDYTELASHEGTIYALRRQFYYKDRTKPIIAYISDDQTSNGNSALLWARSVYDYDGDAIERVWAEVIAPDFNPDSTGQTVVNLPSISLTDPEFDGMYLATCPDDAANCPPDFSFDKQGTYIITYYAEDSSGIYSLPRTSLVRQYGGTLNIVPDQYENDDNLVGAKVIVVNDPSPQNHSFHTANDEDWVKFYGLQGVRYNIKASQTTIISDPIIQVYGSNGTTLKGSSNSSGAGVEESLIWTCPADGLYYVRLTNNSGHYGANVRYKLKVYNPIAFSLPGYVKGRITSGGSGVAGAVIRAGNGTAITLSDGSFILSLPPGSYSGSVSCSGYQSISFTVSVNSGQSVSLSKDINSIPRILNYPPGMVKANELYSYTPVVSDADGDPLTFSITGKPFWASFSTSNGKLWGTPGSADAGIDGPITIRVSDNAGASDSVVFSIEVKKGAGGALPGVYLLLQKN